MDPTKNFVEGFLVAVYNLIDKPVTLFREKIVEPNRQHYPWYHQKYRRVPTIDECYSDDFICAFEADQQYYRDSFPVSAVVAAAESHRDLFTKIKEPQTAGWMVDNEIISIMRSRAEMCLMYNDPDREMCLPLHEAYENAAANWFSKHGDQSVQPKSRDVYMRQKHRMVWERRHGPIGSGMKTED